MIFKDSYGYPVERNGDGGDSTVRFGLLLLCDKNIVYLKELAASYEIKDGWFTRHPIQEPWNNPKNFSRDQTLPFIAGLNRQGLHAPVNRFFWERAKQFFFAQNWERDYPGTTKYLPKDFADPLFFNHIGAIVIAGRVWQFYPLLPFFLLVHLIMIVLHSFTSDFEENQMLAECSIYRTLCVYTCIHKNWERISAKYWRERDEIEYHFMLKELVDDKTR